MLIAVDFCRFVLPLLTTTTKLCWPEQYGNEQKQLFVVLIFLCCYWLGQPSLSTLWDSFIVVLNQIIQDELISYLLNHHHVFRIPVSTDL
jgi:hypothetical protein